MCLFTNLVAPILVLTCITFDSEIEVTESEFFFHHSLLFLLSHSAVTSLFTLWNIIGNRGQSCNQLINFFFKSTKENRNECLSNPIPLCNYVRAGAYFHSRNISGSCYFLNKTANFSYIHSYSEFGTSRDWLSHGLDQSSLILHKYGWMKTYLLP